MAQEKLIVTINERGALTVQRSLKAVGVAGATASKGVGLLKTALLGIGFIGFAAIMNSTIKTLREFSQGMSTVKAVTGATEEQFQQLREEAKKLGAETRFTATQASEGMLFLARAGLNVDEVLKSTISTLRLAQAGALDLGTAADISSNIMTGFGLEAAEMGRVVDVMALTANSANTNIQQLGDAMKFVAPIAAAVGVSIEETAAAIGKLSDAGLQGSLAGTGFRRILTSLEAPTAVARQGILDLGISLDEVKPSVVGIIPAMQKLAEKGLDVDSAMKIFTIRGGTAAIVLSKAANELKDFTTELDDAGGTAKEVSAIMDDNLNGSFLRLGSAMESVKIAFGDLGSENNLSKAIDGLARSTRFWSKNLESVDTLVKSIFSVDISQSQKAIDARDSLAGGSAAEVRKLKVQIKQKQDEVRRLQNDKKSAFIADGGPRNIFEVKGEKVNAKEVEAAVQRKAAFNELKSALETENELLRLNEEERTIRLGVMKAEAAVVGGLTQSEAASVRTLVEQNVAIAEQNKLRKEQTALKEKRVEQFDALIAGLKEETDLLILGTQEREIQRQILEAERGVTGGLTEQERATVRALVEQNQALDEQNRLLERTVDTTSDIAQTAGNVFDTAFNALLSFTQGGAAAFKNFAASIIADLARVQLKKAFLSSFDNAGGGGAGGGAGGILSKLFGFAQGGSVVVGGSGGADSKLFQARVSPGEQIDFTPKGQQPPNGGGGGAGSVNMLTVIVRSEDEAQEIIAGPKGRDAILNVVRENRTTFRQELA